MLNDKILQLTVTVTEGEALMAYEKTEHILDYSEVAQYSSWQNTSLK